MFQRKRRRFRSHSNGRRSNDHSDNNMQLRQRTNSFSRNLPRNNFQPPMSAEKLFEKYSILAKEAMSSGDKTLSENYLQHADHFERIISHKNLNQNENNSKFANTIKEKDNNLSNNSKIDQDQITKSKE